jgi:hypothetical protein
MTAVTSKSAFVAMPIRQSFSLMIQRHPGIRRLRRRPAFPLNWPSNTGATLGNRIRIVCEGANYRGRGRNVNWDCTATFDSATVRRIAPINFWHADKQPEKTADNTVHWNCVTTGGCSAIDIWLEDGAGGGLKINSNIIDVEISLDDIGLKDTTYDCGGLFKALRIFRLPDENTTFNMTLSRKVKLRNEGDTRLYCRVAQEDGHRAWSSPVYLFKP